MKSDKPISEKRRASQRANAKKPRQRMTEELRVLAEKRLGPILRTHGFDGIARLMEQGPVLDPQSFKWAVEFVANRIGLPAVSGVQLEGDALPPVEIVFKLHGGEKAA